MYDALPSFSRMSSTMVFCHEGLFTFRISSPSSEVLTLLYAHHFRSRGFFPLLPISLTFEFNFLKAACHAVI